MPCHHDWCNIGTIWSCSFFPLLHLFDFILILFFIIDVTLWFEMWMLLSFEMSCHTKNIYNGFGSCKPKHKYFICSSYSLCSQTCTDAGRLCGMEMLWGLKGGYTEFYSSIWDCRCLFSSVCEIPNVFVTKAKERVMLHTHTVV